MEFYQSFLRLCNEHGKKPSKVALEIGISKSLVSRWKRGGGTSDSTIQRVADYFGVPISELTEQKEKPTLTDELSERKKEFLNLLDNMSDEDIAQTIDYMNFLKNKHDK